MDAERGCSGCPWTRSILKFHIFPFILCRNYVVLLVWVGNMEFHHPWKSIFGYHLEKSPDGSPTKKNLPTPLLLSGYQVQNHVLSPVCTVAGVTGHDLQLKVWVEYENVLPVNRTPLSNSEIYWRHEGRFFKRCIVFPCTTY